MSSRRNSRYTRCPACQVHRDNCFCDKIEKLDLKTKVSFILFKKEKWLPSNTVNLTQQSLSNCQVFERGHKDQPLTTSLVSPSGYQSIYLFPHEDSKPLESTRFQSPVNLIVPDGTWRQTKKIKRREPLLAKIPSFHILPERESRYLLRRQKFEFGVCTHEAVAYALKILEGDDVFHILMKNFDHFMQSHLKNRDIFEKKKGAQKSSQTLLSK